ncbi:RNA methyltransferase, TrmH family [Propionibacterium cyclohexanicum]|uniref:RNA methyltransferase, TrmH family n=1 Tax=Propionibacterium cyclohexanicum TaxID=64702 RepID=A0A1H9PRT0_9ACTN|nr:RNA methyltransferase [Propionibacterium cyclohexanicum]SER51026.1 RNA methyltransferase, TrmH family [Propionibacterium cyclohexanicum]
MVLDRFDEPDAVPPLGKGALRSARRLAQRKARAETGQFLVEGVQAVREALDRPGDVIRLIVDDPVSHAELVAHALSAQIEVTRAPREVMGALSDTVTSQGIIAVCRWRPAELSKITAPRLVVICAQVRDPGNAGTVVRCADAFGADLVVLTQGSVDITNPKTVRASVGSIFHLPIVTGMPLVDAIAWAHRHAMRVLAADASGSALDEFGAGGGLDAPVAWLMGNEAWGLPSEEIALADQVVAVPMWGRAESLNLSTAAAICLYATASAQHRTGR